MKDKVVIITGASSGIGLAMAREFAGRGSKVVMAARNKEKLEKIESELKDQGYEAFSIRTDVTREDDCRNLVKRTIEKYDRIDVFINNAGISMRALFADVKIDVLKQLMDVNFWGTVYCSKYAIPHLVKVKGSLVGVSSIAGIQGLPGRTGYSASKFALHGLLEAIRVENLKNGLHVMILTAGFTKSEIRKRALMENGKPQGYTPRNEEEHMLPEHVAKAMIKALRNKKRHKIVTIEGQLLALFQRIIPTICDKVAYRRLSREPKSPF
ncbi:MAG: SDR family oxidoreductase [Bacteroidales bacterium]|nr:MAG: SDR family oxidoreductase [Bacteroidales bacterium]